MVSTPILKKKKKLKKDLKIYRVSIRDLIQKMLTAREWSAGCSILTFWCFPSSSSRIICFLFFVFLFVNRKSQSRNDECLVAQERLHPDCARRPERYHLPASSPPASGGQQSTAMSGSMASSSPALGTNEASPPHHTPACHHLAEECKAHPDCK
jgi:hypothetical protein